MAKRFTAPIVKRGDREVPVHQCLTCGNWGVVEKIDGAEMLTWYDRHRPPHLIGREPWPWTSKSPFCPLCWKAIKEKRG